MDTCRFDIFDDVLKNDELQNLRELIKDSIYYRNAISPSSWTTPSHVSMFTGLYPSEHKVHETKNLKQSSMVMNQILNFSGKVLPEILRANGYTTYGFVANPNLAPGTGFERGFDYLAFVDMFEELSELWNDTRQKMKAKFPGSEEDIIILANNFGIKEMLHFAKKNWNFLKLLHLLAIYRDFSKRARKSG
ncbi:MAG: sulfatase-like hydrolase/transferase, partial [Thermoplasmatales archaeon]|nr:sulfatase-like hydrolase/transferase [Thermoplasmatales archaeon]